MAAIAQLHGRRRPDADGRASAREAGAAPNILTGGTWRLWTTDERQTKALGGARQEVRRRPRGDAWRTGSTRGVSNEFEEGEVVRGRVVERARPARCSSTSATRARGRSRSRSSTAPARCPRSATRSRSTWRPRRTPKVSSSSPRTRPTRSRSGTRSPRRYEKGAPVEGRVVEVVKGGLAVDVGVQGVPARLAGRPAPGEEPRRR